jgi:hypothetical protein
MVLNYKITRYLYIYKSWITPGIKRSCNTERELYKTIKSNNDPGLKEHYRKYCRVLGRVILIAKKLYLNKITTNSNNKIKTTWKVIKNMTGNTLWTTYKLHSKNHFIT